MVLNLCIMKKIIQGDSEMKYLLNGQPMVNPV